MSVVDPEGIRGSQANPTSAIPLEFPWKLFDKTRFLKTPHNWDRDTEKWNKNWTYLGTSFLLLSFHSDKNFNICCLGRKTYQWSYKMTPWRTTKPACQAWCIYWCSNRTITVQPRHHHFCSTRGNSCWNCKLNLKLHGWGGLKS